MPDFQKLNGMPDQLLLAINCRQECKLSFAGCQAQAMRRQPREIPARIAPMAESGALRAAQRQIGTQRGDSRSVVDRAGAVSGLNLGLPAA